MSQNSINIEELKKMATNISYDQLNYDNNKNNNYKTSSDDVGEIIYNSTQPKRVSFNKNIKMNSPISSQQLSVNDNVDIKLTELNLSENVNKWNIFGMVIPIHTFYLFFVLLIIGCIIWYFNKSKSNDNINKNTKNKYDKE
jgi:hypothetical protein